MATRRPDHETLAAIRAHWDSCHHRTIADYEIAVERKGRLADTTRVTVTPETASSPAWFTCRACPKGARRYRVDVEVDPVSPPPRHIAAIRRHFRESHGVRRLPENRIYRDPSTPTLAIYERSTPLTGAHVICLLCRPGNNRILIEDPPYGDARSFGWLTTMYPGLVREVAGLAPLARANRLEAHHRQIILPRLTEKAVALAVQAARQGPPVLAPSQVTAGIEVLLATKVASGTPITHVITELSALMETNPVGYAWELAGVIPGLEAHRTLPPEDLATLTRELYGRLERRERTLWTIWRRRSRDPSLAAPSPNGTN